MICKERSQSEPSGHSLMTKYPSAKKIFVYLITSLTFLSSSRSDRGNYKKDQIRFGPASLEAWPAYIA